MTARCPALLTGLLRFLLSLICLLTLLAGLPLVLYIAGGELLPLGLDGLSSPADLFTRQDTGGLALLVLTGIGWAGWANFALAVLLEVPAQLRGRTAPRLRGLRVSQQLAGALVGGLLILLPTAGGAMAAQPAQGTQAQAAVSAQAAPGSLDGQRSAGGMPAKAGAPAGTGVKTSRPTYTVRDSRPADSLWSIAQEQLGDGGRWPEIAALNEGRTMADGRTFRAAGPIQPGWVLRLPAGQKAGGGVAVRRGDTLSQIAEEELGDAERYPELVEANNDRPMDGKGRVLTDPDLIFPGWKVTLPGRPRPAGPPEGPEDGTGSGTGAGLPAESTGPQDRPASRDETASPDKEETAGDRSGEGGAAVRPTPSEPSGTQTPSASRPSTSAAVPGSTTAPASPPATEAPSPSRNTRPPVPAPADAESAPVAMATLATWGGLLAAGLLSTLAVKRTLQQRNRRTGEHIALPRPLPAPPAPPAAEEGNPLLLQLAELERRMRATEIPEGTDLVDRALRTLAHHAAATDRDLPDLAAVRLTSSALELWLDSPAPPLPPFTAAEPNRWTLPADGSGLLTAEDCAEVCAPYPSLVTLGRDEEDALVLADLEALGVLLLPSDPALSRPVLRALAIELATATWSDDLGILLSGLGPELCSIEEGFGRITETGDPAAAVGEVNAWARTVRTVLANTGTGSIRAARLRTVGAEAWTPRIALCAEPLPADLLESARDLLGTPACAALIGAAAPDAMPGATLLPGPAGGTVRLAGRDVRLVPQHITDADYEALLGLFGITMTPASAPLPVPEPARTATVEVPGSYTVEIRLLGTPAVTGVRQEIAPAAAGRLTEIAAWIALHPGADIGALTEAVWPGGVSAAYRTAQLSALRRWLGTDFRHGDTYRFDENTGTDWHRFQVFARRGRLKGTDGIEDLTTALKLVRGRPFDATPPRRYTWAEYLRQDMISAVVDTAALLAELLLAAGEHIPAWQAADTGLLAEPAAENLRRLAIRAAHLAGDEAGVERHASRLDELADELGTQMQPETAELLDRTTPHPTRQ